jgi:superfamily II DNA or RNA helicase
MIRLIINNSISKLENISIPQYKELRKILSYTISDAMIYFSNAFNNKRYLINKKGEFPTGLLYLVEEYLKGKPVEVIDTRKAPKTSGKLFTMKLDVTPYAEQIEAAKAVKHNRGIITAPTGLGKSLITALMINNLQVRTMVVVPSLELKNQLTSSLRSIFGNDKVGASTDNKDIAIDNIDSLSTSKIVKNYDCVIIDEFHHSGAESYRKLNQKAWNNIYYRFGLTATPFRSKSEERLLLESVLSKVIYSIDYRTAVDKGYIVPMQVFYYDLPKVAYKGPNSWASVYSELVVNCENRNNKIAHIINNLRLDSLSTLCLVKEIKHGEILKKLSDSHFANGNNDSNKELIADFNQQKIYSLIGTTGVIGEGIDTKPTEFVILAGGGKSKNQFMQQCGRGFRRYKDKQVCNIIMFRNSNHKWLLKHFNECVKYLSEEYGIIPIKLDF